MHYLQQNTKPAPCKKRGVTNTLTDRLDIQTSQYSELKNQHNIHKKVVLRLHLTLARKKKWIDTAGQLYAFLWTLRSLCSLYSKDDVSSYKAAAIIQSLVRNCLLQQPLVSLHMAFAHRKLHVALKYRVRAPSESTVNSWGAMRWQTKGKKQVQDV